MSTRENPLAFLILGAGPAGLQMGYCLAQLGHEYLIVERANQPGNFFATFPRHRRLISINKVHTGHDDPEINLRWDWNSLLAADGPRFSDYSDDYFPPADAMLRYLAGYAAHHRLAVRYGCEVVCIAREAGLFVLEIAGGERIWARRVIVASGRTRARRPRGFPGAELFECYSSVSVHPDDFRGQRLAILGKGNSAFETADSLVGVTRAIHLLSPEPVRMAWRTHYVGDLRAVNNNVLDTYQLKSQNTILDGHVESLERRADGSLELCFRYSHARGQRWTLNVDRAIACIGFEFDPGMLVSGNCSVEVDSRGFPRLEPDWQAIGEPDLYFAGALMHGVDYRRGFSGFIHGFRYNVACLARLLDARVHERELPTEPAQLEPAAIEQSLIERIERCSSLFQQPGVFTDALIVEPRPRWLRDIPLAQLQRTEELVRGRYLTLTLEYGRLSPGEDPFAIERIPDDGRESKFIHPVLRLWSGERLVDEHHVPEDLENEWDKPEYRTPLRAWLAAAGLQ